jgi:hypothetical protein
MTHHATIQALEEATEDLTKDLQLIGPMLQDLEQVIIDNDAIKHLIVVGPVRIKAYVPKKYKNWEVKFIEWDGKSFDPKTQYYIGTK